MGERRTNRLTSVLKHAKRNEDSALRDKASAQRRLSKADKASKESKERLDELQGDAPVNAQQFRDHQQRAALRADQARIADEELREMLDIELQARDRLKGAIRRRKSLENLEDRRLATQATLAAQAAQRALDELAVLRRQQRRDDA